MSCAVARARTRLSPQSGATPIKKRSHHVTCNFSAATKAPIPLHAPIARGAVDLSDHLGEQFAHGREALICDCPRRGAGVVDGEDTAFQRVFQRVNIALAPYGHTLSGSRLLAIVNVLLSPQGYVPEAIEAATAPGGCA